VVGGVHSRTTATAGLRQADSVVPATVTVRQHRVRRRRHNPDASEDKQARRFRIASDVPVKSFTHPNLVDAVAFDDTGNVLATGGHDGVLRTFDLSKAAALKVVPAHIQTAPTQQAHPIYAIAWTPDHKQI